VTGRRSNQLNYAPASGQWEFTKSSAPFQPDGGSSSSVCDAGFEPATPPRRRPHLRPPSPRSSAHRPRSAFAYRHRPPRERCRSTPRFSCGTEPDRALAGAVSGVSSRRLGFERLLAGAASRDVRGHASYQVDARAKNHWTGSATPAGENPVRLLADEVETRTAPKVPLPSKARNRSEGTWGDGDRLPAQSFSELDRLAAAQKPTRTLSCLHTDVGLAAAHQHRRLEALPRHRSHRV
jgi:hypothetical protein